MGGFALSGVNALWGYACPFCPVVVLDAGLSRPVTVFESHLDEHFSTGTAVVRTVAA